MIAVFKRIAVFLLFIYSVSASAESVWYGARLCKLESEFSCYQVKRGDTWEDLFPNAREQDIVMRVNRIGTRLHPGMLLAVPRDLGSANIMDFSPFPRQIGAPGERIVKISTSQMAWGAYDANGDLVKWGPASSARGYCPDIGGCHTPLGRFAVYQKEGPGCFSRKFPVGRGGAPMPYCMFFHGGFAMHGSYEVPGFNASHGCVRMFVDDAEWLNEDFTDIGTPVIVSH